MRMPRPRDAKGHELRRIEIAKLDFPLYLRTQAEFETGAVPPALVQPPTGHAVGPSNWVLLFPLWHGTMPALVKGFLEHVFRPGFRPWSTRRRDSRNACLAGRSAPHRGNHGDCRF